MNSGPITKLRQNITTIMAAVSVAVVAIPAGRAAEPDLVSALRDKGAQIMLSLPFIPSCLPTTARLSGTDIILSQWIL